MFVFTFSAEDGPHLPTQEGWKAECQCQYHWIVHLRWDSELAKRSLSRYRQTVVAKYRFVPFQSTIRTPFCSIHNGLPGVRQLTSVQWPFVPMFWVRSVSRCLSCFHWPPLSSSCTFAWWSTAQCRSTVNFIAINFVIDFRAAAHASSPRSDFKQQYHRRRRAYYLSAISSC